VAQSRGIKTKVVDRRVFENSCVGGSIPPHTTKKAKPSLAITRAFCILGLEELSYGTVDIKVFLQLSICDMK